MAGNRRIIELEKPNVVPVIVNEKKCGSHNQRFQDSIERQVVNALSLLPDSESIQLHADAGMWAVEAFEPSNEIEGMMAVQMVSLHHAIMQCYNLAWGDIPHSLCAQYLNHASKLSRSFIAMLDAYNKNRGKGQQKITVEHVTVAQGGQAIIGNVEKQG